ncbi:MULTISPECIES: hypothetical protein [Microbacterium]|uniref:DUF4064 domain-containing protein n=1 Tax=Microbacterium wangchenii TaxID=2541726 RepID=A0ABX5ST67_9MICO|nr:MULTISPECIES: hypothetical protein [Microbacterium]MCK6067724.1 hypothetical protein [Microbacterium sp. EYE_512]QBR89363.1 hypothetical protein E4K62_12155 [Microbacterium wangchenii]TXK11036.1 hypothetical protein FVP99_17225 [Microbacterium wangchenii]
MSNTSPDPANQPTPPPAYPAPSAPAGGYAPAAGQPTGKEKGPARLGIIAFAASLAGAVIGSIIAFIAGMQFGGLVAYTDSSGNFSGAVPPEAEQIAVTSVVLAVVAFVVWGALALWGFIQGIIAAVKNRGRVWGIVAIVLAVIGVGAVSMFYGIGAAAGAAPYLA